MNVVFLGYTVSRDEANTLKGASIAGNKMQLNIVSELSAYEDVAVTCVTITPHAVFPSEKVVRQRYAEERLNDKVRMIRIPYINLPLIKQLSQIWGGRNCLKKLMREQKDTVLIGYNQFPQVGIPMKYCIKHHNVKKTVCLLADLPFDDNTARKGFSTILRKMFDASTWSNLTQCDTYIVLNEYVAQKYLPGKPYIVIDGGVDENDIKKYPKTEYNPTEHNVLFCGALTEYNGILNLLKAMELLDDTDIKLDIYGSGYLENAVKEAVEKNSNIRFHGRVSNDVVLQKQREAWLLINPRVIDDSIAKVTFPSKTFEYLLSGTPVLSTKLKGYGAEYAGKMFFSDGDSAEELADAIKHVYRMPKETLAEISDRAHEFVLKEKTWRTQVGRVRSFLRVNTQGECE